ncbi:MAG: glycosyltransferase family 4 protein [Planctomycetaceae bacterium]|nr:glycosyltransferase family 4 protein [Planctomycetaceae bacterium]
MRVSWQQLVDRARSVLTGRPAFEFAVDRAIRSAGTTPEPVYDLVYILPPKNLHGWILEAICREIDAHVPGRTAFADLHERVPPARAYFYSHYGYFRTTLLSNPHVIHGNNVLFYTHPRELWYSEDELKYVLRSADSVLSMCSLFVSKVEQLGVPPERIHTGLLGADPHMFQPHQRGVGRVGFCSAYQPRKSGDRILEIVRQMPHRRFVLCGKKWSAWEKFEELCGLPNFEYLELPYQQYPDFYESIDVFVSVSQLEGGPVPLIESAMCNVVPVCSDTGHARDIITPGENGFIFDVDAPVGEVCRLIDQACELRADIRSTVEHLTWARFSRQVQSVAGLLTEACSSGSLLSDAA